VGAGGGYLKVLFFWSLSFKLQKERTIERIGRDVKGRKPAAHRLKLRMPLHYSKSLHEMGPSTDISGVYHRHPFITDNIGRDFATATVLSESY
jgi:hypothetical protein